MCVCACSFLAFFLVQDKLYFIMTNTMCTQVFEGSIALYKCIVGWINDREGKKNQEMESYTFACYIDSFGYSVRSYVRFLFLHTK